MTAKLQWTTTAHGDEYILGERSYAVLFKPGQREKSLRSIDRWMDIGAHIGSFSLRAAQYVHEVVAVEPEPLNIQHLRENLRLNNIENVRVIEGAAIGGSETQVQLGLGKTFTYTHKVGYTRGRHHITVPAYNVNSLVESYNVNKLKIDCEGSEYDILKNLDYGPIEEIILEWHFTLIPDPRWDKMWEALRRFRDEGFVILRAPENYSKRWTAIIWVRRTSRE